MLSRDFLLPETKRKTALAFCEKWERLSNNVLDKLKTVTCMYKSRD